MATCARSPGSCQVWVGDQALLYGPFSVTHFGVHSCPQGSPAQPQLRVLARLTAASLIALEVTSPSGWLCPSFQGYLGQRPVPDAQTQAQRWRRGQVSLSIYLPKLGSMSGHGSG